MTLAIPETTFIVTFTALGLGIVTNLLTIRFVDLAKERRMKAEIAQHNKELREAMKSKDKAKEEKLKKKDVQIKQMNAKVSTARLRVTAITFIPFIVLYYLMAGFLGGFNVVVAHSPFVGTGLPILFNPDGSIVLFWWYTISSLTFSPMLTKLFRTST
ncbi:MAG: EMC3/TMCO1 family protein [Nitrososphaerales archaeon]|nr:EMC3/TMCO1 family protein [Nitrososphaerales archaeon]